MTARRRFWVEVSPRFAAVPVAAPVIPPPVAPSSVPRLTALAVVAGLDGAELDAEVASVHRQIASLQAYEAGLIERKATLGAQHPLPFAPGTRTDTRVDAAVDTDPSPQAADDYLADEVAVLLNMSVPSARHHVDHVLTLVRQVPEVWYALADQRIDETRAKVIVRALGYQAVSHGGPVADSTIDDLAAHGVEWAARGCAPTTLRERLDAALIGADPAAADRRRELRKRTADVKVVGTGDGLADLTTSQLDAADAKLVRAQIDAYARQIKAGGDSRPIGEIRVGVVVALITRPWEQVDPAIAHLTVHADLADLLLPDLSDLITNAADEDPGHVGPGAEEPVPGETADDEPTDREGATDADPRVGSQPAQESAGNQVAGHREPLTEPPGRSLPIGGSSLHVGGDQVGHIGELPVSPAAVRELLRRIDALGLTHPENGDLTFTVSGSHGRLLAVATPEELAAVGQAGRGIGPPPATSGYAPTAAQYRYLRARDRHCRFPGCRQVARACDADHVIPYDHRAPSAGGSTCVRNLVMLCRRHHRLKTHAPGWRFRLDADGTLHVTTPGGTTRSTRTPAADQVLDFAAESPPPPYDPADDPPPF